MYSFVGELVRAGSALELVAVAVAERIFLLRDIVRLRMGWGVVLGLAVRL
jgi:hypothetical protein